MTVRGVRLEHGISSDFIDVRADIVLNIGQNRNTTTSQIIYGVSMSLQG